MSLREQSAPRPLDLSKVRHELRTPINHILGYCDILLEDDDLPAVCRSDLFKVHSGGRQLLSLINHYFDEKTFATLKIDLHQLSHELRTPVNHIVGYCELLEEQAAEGGSDNLKADLRKINAAALTWLELMEEHLVPSAENGAGEFFAMDPGVGFVTPVPKSAVAPVRQAGRLLVVDDDPTNREMLARRLKKEGYDVTLSENGLQGIKLLRANPFDLVLLDLIMPGLDGYQVLTRLKADPALKHIPVIMISALDQENGISRCIELGAEDYIAKPFSPVFLRARIGASLEKKRLRDQERKTYEALLASQKQLAGELAEAAQYVQSLLPSKEVGEVSTDWAFRPSADLGGDVFGYHWLDRDHFAIYLLDVCGHGVGAALLSVTALNVLTSQSLSGADFKSPASVLSALNKTFRMEKQNNLYFTIWYGVYHAPSRRLAYASGGHPPALLASPGQRQQLRTAGAAVGCLDDFQYLEQSVSVPPRSELIVLSDGVYEVAAVNGQMWTYLDFLSLIEPQLSRGEFSPHTTLAEVERIHGHPTLEDDFSLLKVSIS